MFDLKLTLEHIASIDVQTLMKKDAEYASSWKKRGGIGAFFTFIRKADRLEAQMTVPANRQDGDGRTPVPPYEIFERIEQSVGGTESVLETLRDLRRYLLLVESEIERRKNVDNYGTGSGSDASGQSVNCGDHLYSREFFEQATLAARNLASGKDKLLRMMGPKYQPDIEKLEQFFDIQPLRAVSDTQLATVCNQP